MSFAAGTLSDQIARMLAAGDAVRDIAATLGCQKPYVRVIRQRLRDKAAPAADPQARAAAPPQDPLLATGGRYRDLAAYAAQHGLTSTQALSRYHKLRAARGAA